MLCTLGALSFNIGFSVHRKLRVVFLLRQKRAADNARTEVSHFFIKSWSEISGFLKINTYSHNLTGTSSKGLSANHKLTLCGQFHQKYLFLNIFSSIFSSICRRMARSFTRSLLICSVLNSPGCSLVCWPGLEAPQKHKIILHSETKLSSVKS